MPITGMPGCWDYLGVGAAGIIWGLVITGGVDNNWLLAQKGAGTTEVEELVINARGAVLLDCWDYLGVGIKRVVYTIKGLGTKRFDNYLRVGIMEGAL